ncbi:histidine kinase N-terminal 7TM domain-containing diguanylate cyclase [Breznakiella homolactica]|uniref:diguanylate cyclase n=1 Tax=Breznakiella homolactica TaxID=2798577 RepID=A0A7T7XPT1_9SPIR|nr:diguanylate cyclase [Breznakiella homolactica]QQO10238.1 diguanylate cyclase [Breznakiella homolactica]
MERINPFFLIQFAVCLVSAFLLIWAIRMHRSPKSRYFFHLSMTAFFYSWGYLLELDSRSLGSAYTALRVQYCGVAFFAVVFYLFIRDYNNRGITRKFIRPLFLVLPFCTVLLVSIFPYSRLYFRSIEFTLEPFPHLIVERGLFFYIHSVYCFIFIVLSIAEIIRYYPHAVFREKVKRLVFLSAAIIPSITVIIFTITKSTIPMQFGSASLVVTLLILGIYIVYFQAQDWLPYTRESIVEKIHDGFVLLDLEGRYLDSNQIAKKYFPSIETVTPGTPVSEIEGFPREYAGISGGEFEFTAAGDAGNIYLRASVTSIPYRDKPVCTCILFYDISEQHTLMSELESQASFDDLTGLLNRRNFFKVARRDFDLALREERYASLIMIDIDHFKQVNDRHGHPAGDKVLKCIAEIITDRLRHTDAAGRYGGEEFCIILPGTSLEGAFTIAEKIRRMTEESTLHINGTPLRVTLSMGIAEINPGRHRILEELIADADKALYAAKDAGRNRIECFEIRRFRAV